MKNGFYATYRSKNKGKDKRSINLSVFLNSLLADNHHLQACKLGVIMVIAVSCVKLLSAHNSTQHTSRKHKV